MEQSPSWEANRFSAAEEIPHILWNPKVHYRTHKLPPPLSWASSIQSISPHPPSWRSILILSSHLRLRLPSGLFTSGLPYQNPLYSSLLTYTRYMSRPSPSRFDHPNNIGWRILINLLLIMKFSPPPCYLVPLRPKYSPQHHIGENNSYNWSFSLQRSYRSICCNVWVRVFRKTGKLKPIMRIVKPSLL